VKSITKNKNPNYRHGYEGKPEYSTWAGMCQRCTNKNADNYKYYGGRGISVCDLWRNNPGEFIKWLHDNEWQKGMHVDRIDNDGGYSPENCRIVTPQANFMNKPVKHRNNTSGYGGVSFSKSTCKWQAVARIHGKRKYLGVSKKPFQAALYRDAYILAHGGLLPMNFPEVATCK